ncbi:MAG: prepilin-type N-terminal cleavage/methylation domain-containing protein [Candidatus Staskawiczbacteria bacterium]|nr:prepilin-type N-terminal cleavage/methylation domain-containing protein [Candidatus Staskawiczbacteria bacterium]
MNFQKGFTLIEAVVVTAIVAVLMMAVSSMLVKVFSGSKQQYLALDNIDNARIASSRFVNEIRSAVPGVDGSSAISTADSDEIIFHTPDRGDNTLIDRVRYFIQDNVLYKGVIKPTGSPLAYTSSESISAVQPNLTMNGADLFYYYDGNYSGDTQALSQPVNINDIRFVKINLIVLKQTEQGSDSVFYLSTGAATRSLKDNLGD